MSPTPSAPAPDAPSRPGRLEGPVLCRQSVRDAAARAAGRIAPLWPLDSFVAVNPFLGLSERRFAEATAQLARAAGARTTMPRAFYLEAIDGGRIAEEDLGAALRACDDPAAPGSVAALLEQARQPEPAREPLTTVAGLAGREDGRDWAGFAAERIALWAAAHFAASDSAGAGSAGAGSAYAAWRERALADRTPEIAGLAGFRGAVGRLPGEAGALLVAASRRLGLAPAGIDAYFHRLLMSIGGWAAHARWRVWQAALAGRHDGSLLELLAVRLAWDAALFELYAERPGFAGAWAEARREADRPAQAGRFLVDGLLQEAYERAWQRELAGRFAAAASTAPATQDGRPAVQAVFCIDVRSEVYRRALESVSDGVETLGFAGFFGLPIELRQPGDERGRAQCPVLLAPGHTVCEAPAEAAPEAIVREAASRRLRRRAAGAWSSFRLAAVSSFAFVETAGLAYLGKLTADTFGLGRRPADAHAPGPRLDGCAEVPGGGGIGGIAPAARVALAAGILSGLTMTEGFARLVLLAGHGASTTNNPHARGLDCGACGGQSGAPNARLAAALLNDPAVRSALRDDHGIAIPEDTHFLAGLHDTTSDCLTILDPALVPSGHRNELARLEDWLEQAGKRTRAERAGRLGLAQGPGLLAAMRARGRDWSQVRPEWGLAGCAAFVAAPRRRTAGLDLGGRAFLHSYDWRRDEGFATLEQIMAAPMVVASWISLQYYGSTVDNRVFGSGDKTLHNVVGRLGVIEGNGGDLRVGLPWQSLHDGERLVHEPLRLSVVIEAPREAINNVIDRQPAVRNLVENGWLHLFTLDGSGEIAWRYAGAGQWTACRARPREAAARPPEEALAMA